MAKSKARMQDSQVQGPTGMRLPSSTLLSLGAAVQVDGQWRQAGGLAVPQGEEFISSWSIGETTTATIRRRDGRSFTAQQVRLEIVSVLLNYAHVVVVDCGRHYILARQAFQIRAPLYRVSQQNAGHPFFALADEAGNFLMAFGLVSHDGELCVRRLTPGVNSRKALVGGDDLLTLHMEYPGPREPVKELSLEVFFTEQAPTWFHALRRYSDAIKRRDKIVYVDNPDAWRPTWCTWPAWISDQMSDQTVLANARIAKELGIGTIILDDGWFGPGLDTEGQVLNLGDYQPDPKKFRDLPGLIRQMQEMGLKVLLWFASLPIAQTSQLYQKMKKYLMYENGKEAVSSNGLALLCPACPEVRKYVADEIERLLRTYNCDGFKVDLYNNLPHDFCTSPHHDHDIQDGVKAVEACMAELWQRVSKIKPDLLIELKQDYGNTRLIRHGTMVRAGDTAYDIDAMTWRTGYAQAYANVVHNDYLITGTYNTPQAMALLMIRILTGGVPTFGLHFPKFSQELRDVIAAWLKLYNRNLGMFRKPREPQNNDLSAWQGGDKKLAWVSAARYCREITLPDAKRILLMNGTGEDNLYLKLPAPRNVRVTTYDWKLKKLGSEEKTLRPGMRLSVRSGGMLDICG